MIWVGWREQRTEAIIAAAILLALALLLVPAGLHMASAYHDQGLSICVGAHPAPACPDLISSFLLRFEKISKLLAWLTLLPGLIGVLLAAPFAFQFEHGTYRLDWTQSITPRRWIGVKLGLAVAAALAASLVLIVLVTWSQAPLVHLQGRMNDAFDGEGTVVFGYTLFALGLALALGIIWRRAVPAVLIAFGAYVASRLFVDIWLRQRLTPPLETTWKFGGPEPAALRHAWVINEGSSDSAGHVLVRQHIGSCLNASKGAKACLIEHAPNYMHAVYEPASRFWTMQAIETSLFGLTALALIAFAAWWARRRAA